MIPHAIQFQLESILHVLSVYGLVCMWFMMSAANRVRVDLLYIVKIVMSP
jgi:hypothetical protein